MSYSPGHKVVTIFNLMLRLSTLSIKFFFILWLASVAGVDLIGEYGVVLACISISTFISGFEVHNISANFFHPENNKGVMISHLIITISISLLISLVTFNMFFLDFSPPLAIVSILVLEVFAAEYQKVIIYLGKHVFSNVINFLRLSLMPSLIVFFYYTNDVELSMRFIFEVWLYSQLFIFICILNHFNYALKHESATAANIARQIKVYSKEIKTIIFFFISALSFRFILGGDRVIFDMLTVNKASLGIYVLYISIAASTLSIFEVLILNTRISKLVSVGYTFQDYTKALGYTVLLFIVISISGLFILPILISFIGDEKVYFSSEIFIILNLSFMFLAASLLFHYDLVGKKLAKENLFIGLFVMFIFFSMIYFLHSLGIKAINNVPLAFCIAMFSSLTLKSLILYLSNMRLINE
ncbi:hypothetical protein BG00_09420 [Pseudoalteromonas sp. SCSIO_11900]|uniref:hypothetical protein n=1 Tax=Pseudoalteromonas sp. SCSIO_11900 TaxID=1461766 RepID=UPI00044DEABD|nr:hypothetical protein [Pseudoalteromonas sp. SCSIO_11900]EWS98599.1 hypothetical protein BG00_09420 [Pseudoalteromonas sp. SCSIO_11900]